MSTAPAPGALAADVQIDLAIRFGEHRATERLRFDRIALAAGTTEHGDPVYCQPLRPADDNRIYGLAPCPVYRWCMGHESGEHITADTAHRGETHHAGTYGLALHAEAGVVSIAVAAASGDVKLLDPDEADELAAVAQLYAQAARSVTA